MALLDFYSVFLVIFTALLLSLAVLTQFLAIFASDIVSASGELGIFTSYLESSVQENKSFDIDISSLVGSASLKDRMRLSLLLQEIQKCGDDMRENLNRLLATDLDTSASSKVSGSGEMKLKSGARLLWGSKKKALEDMVKKIDMLRLRFLVVYMSIVASSHRINHPPTPPRTPEKQIVHPEVWAGRNPKSRDSQWSSVSSRDSTDMASSTMSSEPRPGIAHAMTDGMIASSPQGNGGPKVPPLQLRMSNTQSMGHNDNSGGGQRMGWMGVVAELQRSPVMRERHASIERSGGGRPNIAKVFDGLP